MNTSNSRRNALLAATSALTLVVAGCGGSSDSPADATATISGIAADGPLQGATACYDLNDNGACDSGEPTSVPTAADGGYSIDVGGAEAGRHAVVVMVPATAVDQTTGAAIGAPITLVAPATGTGGSQRVFVSPLTTMVADQMKATGATAADAAAVIQAQAGLAVSPLADFLGTPAAQQQAALVARLAVQAQIALANALAPEVGRTDASGLVVTQADVDAAARNALRSALPAIAASAAAVPTGGTAAEVQAALVAAASELVASHDALEPAGALLVTTSAKLSPGRTTIGEAAAVLRGFAHTDANNWTLRYFASNAADNTPDASGLVRFYDVHRAANAGVISEWYFATSEARKGDLHWNGSLWRDCGAGLRSTATLRDAEGRSNYDFCDGFERGVSTRSVLDIAGQPMASVISNVIRRTPGSDDGVAYANWGPADLSRLGSATFPAGAELYFQTSTATSTAPAYDVTAPVGTYGSEAGAGGDARSNTTLACHAAFTGAISPFGVGTLEQLAAIHRGTPCIENPQSDAGGPSLDPNVWWGATSVSLGTVIDGQTRPAGTGTFYSANANLRVAFTGGNAVTFLRCFTRTSNGSPRNCTAIGSGTYAIQTLGDGRAMTFDGLPADAQRLSFTRIFVERGGTVYFGYRNKINVAKATVRLNLPAANALLGTLGVPLIAP
jgi:hypothetical protein